MLSEIQITIDFNEPGATLYYCLNAQKLKMNLFFSSRARVVKVVYSAILAACGTDGHGFKS